MRLHPYRCESADPTWNAERNLEGRTYYASPNTLKYFKARILDSGHAAGGALFWLIESLPMTHRNDKRGFRYRVFDLCGNVVAGKSETADQFHSKREGAEKALRAALAAIDAAAVNREAIEWHAIHETEQCHRALQWVRAWEANRAAGAA